jgi:aminoglycoside phosphotransferase (APT) family kinase protein
MTAQPCGRRPTRHGARPKPGSRRCGRRSAELIEDEAVGVALIDALPAAAPVVSLDRILQGWGNESWIADTALGRLVVKVGQPWADAVKWRAAEAGLELARDNGVPVPELLAFVDAVGSLDGRVLRVFRYIPGTTPTVDASPSFFRQLGTALRHLHSIAMPSFTARVGEEGFPRWSAFLEHRWTAVAGRAAVTGIDAALVTRARTLSAALAAEVDELVRPALCHRDLYLDNVLVDDDGSLVALLDFDIVEAWDPVVDFFKPQWFIFEPNSAAHSPFFEGYLGGDLLPPLFDERLRLASIIELANHAANWRVQGQLEIAAEALARLDLLVNSGL